MSNVNVYYRTDNARYLTVYYEFIIDDVQTTVRIGKDSENLCDKHFEYYMQQHFPDIKYNLLDAYSGMYREPIK